MNKSKVILDLCGGTGSWSKPYADAGYTVRVITIPKFDIRLTRIENGYLTFRGYDLNDGSLVVKMSSVYGILAAPPCTMFSFARTNAKKPRDIHEGMECVRACLEIIWACMEVSQDTNKKTLPLKFWALENPYHGFLKHIIGRPAFTFDPYEFGDGYKKRTALWGNFHDPKKLKNGQVTGNTDHNHSKMVKFDQLKTKEIHSDKYGELTRQERRSITPQGFSNAFYKANP